MTDSRSLLPAGVWAPRSNAPVMSRAGRAPPTNSAHASFSARRPSVRSAGGTNCLAAAMSSGGSAAIFPSHPVDERVQLGRRYRTVDPPVGGRGVRIHQVTGEQQLQRPVAPHPLAQVLRSSVARHDAHQHLALTDACGFPRGEGHVGRRDELGASGSRPARQFDDRHLRLVTQQLTGALEEIGVRVAVGDHPQLVQLVKDADVDVSDEELGVGAGEDNDVSGRPAVSRGRRAVRGSGFR